MNDFRVRAVGIESFAEPSNDEELDPRAIDRLGLDAITRELTGGVEPPDLAKVGTPDFILDESGASRPIKHVPKAVLKRIDDSGPALNVVMELTAPAEPGWVYFKLPDPFENRLELVEVTAEDGRVIPKGARVWTSRERVGQSPPRWLIHLLDEDGPGRYRITMRPRAAAPTSAPRTWATRAPHPRTGPAVASLDTFETAPTAARTRETPRRPASQPRTELGSGLFRLWHTLPEEDWNAPS